MATPQGKGSGNRSSKGGGNSARRGKGGGKGQGRGGKGQGGGGQGGKGRGKPPETDQTQALRQRLAKVLSRLPETQRQVLEYRMGLVDGHPHNLSDTARELGLTMHEAKKIEERAFEHIREAVPIQHLQKFLGARPEN